MLGRATDLFLGLSPLGTCLTTPRPWLWRDWHWEAIHFLLQTYSETTFSSFQAHSSLPCWFGLPQQENVATHSISTLICHPAVVATNTLFSPPHYQQVHFNVRNVNFFCHFVSSCHDSTVTDWKLYMHRYSRTLWMQSALHWSFLVEWGCVEGGIWGWSTCAHFKMDHD